MTIQIPLDEDHHVHSSFSDDAVSTLDQNVAAARQRRLRVLCLAEHVRRDSAWVPAYLAEVEALRPVAGLAVLAGVEAKILDRTGQLDLPDDAAGADRVLIADHQFPGALGPVQPREVRDAMTAGSITAGEVISGLIEATAGALERVARPQLAHLFSVLPKMGIAETAVPDAAIGHLAGRAAAAGAMLEVNEKWACPSARTVRAFAAAGVTLVASTDSHDCRDIGVYSAVRQLAGGLPPDPVR
ncbi:MAG TPA: PHP domain-containing protein [Streptosporangiaceae bacterium]